ncbi:MAG: glucokinase [Gallionellaceae bacterium]|nr:glucokinase [Gallionellaceae bacterium]
MSYFLAGDIGGTKTLLQIFKEGSVHEPLLRKSYSSVSYAGLEDIVSAFLVEANVSDVTAACFALAGPVSGRVASLTNLPWVVNADVLAARFGIERITLINDFEAVGLGVAAMEAADLLLLQQGVEQEQGLRVVVGAGTGLGVAWLNVQNGKYIVHPSEGGHLDFAPIDETQYELLRYLQQRHHHVSYERIVSGPGLVTIFEFLRDTNRAAPSVELAAAMSNGDAAAVISSFAREQQEEIAVKSLNLFTKIYGAFVGNIALVALPRGGIYIAGGIAAKISSQMQTGCFMQTFLDKGRFKDLLATLPMFIVLNPEIGLLGASVQAMESKQNYL